MLGFGIKVSVTTVTENNGVCSSAFLGCIKKISELKFMIRI